MALDGVVEVVWAIVETVGRAIWVVVEALGNVIDIPVRGTGRALCRLVDRRADPPPVVAFLIGALFWIAVIALLCWVLL